MSRTRSPEVAKRNDAIYAEWLRGSSLTSLGERYSLSRQVVGRIVAAQHPEEDEDNDRSVYRGFLWRLFDEVKDLYDSPGLKMTPTGRPAEGPDGEPAEDTGIKLQAAELELKILESLRKLDARDRPQKKTLLLTTEADEARLADIARRRGEMEALARRAGQPAVIPGEVERPAIEG